jgi:hypothetical protein
VYYGILYSGSGRRLQEDYHRRILLKKGMHGSVGRPVTQSIAGSEVEQVIPPRHWEHLFRLTSRRVPSKTWGVAFFYDVKIDIRSAIIITTGQAHWRTFDSSNEQMHFGSNEELLVVQSMQVRV